MDTTDLETISSDWHHEIMQKEIDEVIGPLDHPFSIFIEKKNKNSVQNFKRRLVDLFKSVNRASLLPKQPIYYLQQEY